MSNVESVPIRWPDAKDARLFGEKGGDGATRRETTIDPQLRGRSAAGADPCAKGISHRALLPCPAKVSGWLGF